MGRRRVRRARIPAAAALLAMVLYAAQCALRGTYPFGPRSDQVNDLWAQVVPFAAELRRVIWLQSDYTTPTWTWTMGGGVPALGTYTTYLGGPLFPLTALLPASKIELAVWFVVLGWIGIAAASMVVLLRNIRPHGSPVVAVLLACGYAMCAWTINDANYFPAWLSGMALAPLLVLVARWTVAGRRFVVGTLVVTLTWWSNYYSAYMASLGAVIILVITLIAEGHGPKRWARAIATFALQGALGVGLTFVLLWPTYREVGYGVQLKGAEPAWVPFDRLVGHLMGWAEGVTLAPSFAVGPLGLVLAVALVGQREHRLRLRLAWAVGLVAVIASFAAPSTLWVWNLGDTPNGSLFRGAFVVALMVTIMAWYAADRLSRVAWWGWLASVVVTGSAIAIAALGGARSSQPLFASIGLAATVVVLIVFARMPRRSNRVVVSWVLAAVVAIDLVGSAAWTLDARTGVIKAHNPMTPTAQTERDAAREAASRTRWPLHRVAVASNLPNSGARAGLPTIGGYSSLIPNTVSDAFSNRLGMSMSTGARSILYSAGDAAADAIAAIDTRVDPATGEITPVNGFPLVRELPASAQLEYPRYRTAHPKAEDAFPARNRLFATPVYTQPRATITGLDAKIGVVQRGWGKILPNHRYRIDATCPANSAVTFDARRVSGTIRHAGFDYELSGGLVDLGRVGPDGKFSAELTSGDGVKQWLLMKPVGCLNTQSVSAQVGAAQSPEIQVRGDRLTATFAAPVKGAALVAMAPVAGYRCQVDGKTVPSRTYQGLLAVEMNGARQVSCAYQAPGLRLGAAGSAASGAALALIGVLGWWHGRRRATASDQDQLGHREGERHREDARDEGSPALVDTHPLHHDDRPARGHDEVDEGRQGELEEAAPRRAHVVGEEAVHEEREDDRQRPGDDVGGQVGKRQQEE